MAIDPESLATWLETRRWFRRRGPIEGIEVEDRLGELLELIRVRAAGDGSIDRYQLLGRSSRGGVEEDPERLLEHLRAGRGSFETESGRIVLEGELPEASGELALVAEESSNTLFRQAPLCYKFYRYLCGSRNPEVELLEALGRQGFRHIPRIYASISYRRDSGRDDLAIVLELIEGLGDLWEEGVGTAAALPTEEIGQVTALLHTALAESDELEVRRPSAAELEALEGRVKREVIEALQSLGHVAPELPERSREVAARLGGFGSEWVEAVGGFPAGEACWIRTHGDYHLGQVGRASDRLVILDFEGEPLREVEERRRPMPAARDLAGMVRSFDYAARFGGGGEALVEAARRGFIDAYWATNAGAEFLPPGRDELEDQIDFLALEKAAYELRYELAHRPGWAWIPIEGLIALATSR